MFLFTPATFKISFFIPDFQHFSYDMLRSLGEVVTYSLFLILCSGFPDCLMVKNLPVGAGATGDAGSISGSGRSTGGGNSNPLQYSCLENPMDRGAWQAISMGLKELDTTELLSTQGLTWVPEPQ